MKKIYSKFTVERKEPFQIETSIVLEDGEKKVIKTPLTEQSEQHVQNMYTNYEKYGHNSGFLLAPCKKRDNGVVCLFVDGKSFCSKLLERVEKQDKPGFVELLLSYKKLTECLLEAGEDRFHESDKFVEVFGHQDIINGKIAGNHVNIDLTFDNIIINDEGVKTIIDYEWYFDFLIPIDFVLYRAIHGFFVKYSQMLSGFATEQEILQLFGIKQQEAVCYNDMDMHFVAYVFGTEDSYDSILNQYKKELIEVKSLIQKTYHYATLFVDDGTGYSEEHTVRVQYEESKKEQTITFDVSGYEKIEAVRFDPYEQKGVIELKQVVCVDTDGKEDTLEVEQHNAAYQHENFYLFETMDPQFVCDIPEDSKVVTIKVTFVDTNISSKMFFGVVEKIEQDNKIKMQEQQVAFEEIKVSYEAMVQEMSNQLERIQKERDLILINKQGLEQRLNVLANDYHMLVYEKENNNQ